MMFRTPGFWYRPEAAPPPLIERALSPLSCVYGLANRLKNRLSAPSFQAQIPVICVGNIVAGGSGKTPVSLALMSLIREAGLAHEPAFLTRGYGGSMEGPAFAGPQHSFRETGDEALLLAGKARTIVARRRAAGAMHAQNNGCDLVIMDDGMQNHTLRKDMTIMVIRGETGFGNRKLLPAGPLREPLEAGLRRADAFVITGEDRQAVSALLPEGKPVFHAGLRPVWNDPWQGPYLAFAGLAHPDSFFNFLRDDLHVNVQERFSFPDHHPYNTRDLEMLQGASLKHGARLLTTEKDAVRLPPAFREKVSIVPVVMEWQDRDAVLSFMKQALENRKRQDD